MWRRDLPKHSKQDALSDLVQSIADRLTPWRKPLTQGQVFNEIESAIDRLKKPSLSQHVSSLVGSGRMRRQEAKRLLVTLKTLSKQVTAAGLTFDLRLRPANQLGLWTPKHTQKSAQEILYDEFLALLSAKDSRLDHQKLLAAFHARLLVEKLSNEKLTISSDGNTPFCVIASQLFEAVTGRRECNVIRACRHVYRLRSERI
jgi:hypothetical protein